jgi:hypothetical protein
MNGQYITLNLAFQAAKNVRGPTISEVKDLVFLWVKRAY